MKKLIWFSMEISKMKNLYLYLFLIIFSTGCESIDYSNRLIKLHLEKENPTSYVFDFPLSKIKAVLKEGVFNEYNSYNPYLVHYRKILGDSLKYLTNEEYYSISESNYLSMSRLYVSRDMEPLPSFSKDIIWLIPVEKNKTEVRVLTYYNKVMLLEPTFNSVASNILSCGNVPLPSTGKTESTTIEEYEILQLIGEALGIKDKMPPINYPDYSNLKIIHYKYNVIYMDQVLNNGKNEKWKKIYYKRRDS